MFLQIDVAISSVHSIKDFIPKNMKNNVKLIENKKGKYFIFVILKTLRNHT